MSITRREDLRLSRTRQRDVVIDLFEREATGRPRVPVSYTLELRTRDGATDTTDGAVQLQPPYAALPDAEEPGALSLILPAVSGTRDPEVQLVVRWTLASGLTGVERYLVPVDP
jgi:hypothetical protein